MLAIRSMIISLLSDQAACTVKASSLHLLIILFLVLLIYFVRAMFELYNICRRRLIPTDAFCKRKDMKEKWRKVEQELLGIYLKSLFNYYPL